jgi:hypothetical protein
MNPRAIIPAAYVSAYHYRLAVLLSEESAATGLGRRTDLGSRSQRFGQQFSVPGTLSKGSSFSLSRARKEW